MPGHLELHNFLAMPIHLWCQALTAPLPEPCSSPLSLTVWILSRATPLSLGSSAPVHTVEHPLLDPPPPVLPGPQPPAAGGCLRDWIPKWVAGKRGGTACVGGVEERTRAVIGAEGLDGQQRGPPRGQA